MKLIAVFLSLIISLSYAWQAHGTLAFRAGNGPVTFLWADKGKVQYRKCSVRNFSFTELEEFATTLLPLCEKDPKRGTFSFNENTYLVSLAALYGVPTSFFGSESPSAAITNFFARREDAFREGKSGPGIPISIERFLGANEEIVDFLDLDRARVLDESDEEYGLIRYNAMSALTSIYSDGTTAVTLGKSVGPAKVLEACEGAWGTASTDSVLEILNQDAPSFKQWYATVNPKSKDSVMTWRESFTEKPVRDGQTAYVRAFTTSSFNLAARTTAAVTGNYVYPTVCVRRALYSFNHAHPFEPNGALTLEDVSKLYQLSPQALYSKILASPDLETQFADFHLSGRRLSLKDFNERKGALDRHLGIGLADWNKLEAEAITQEKRVAEYRAQEAARIAAEEKAQKQRDAKYAQEEKKRQAQLAWDRQQQEIRDRQRIAQEQKARDQFFAQQRAAEAERQANIPLRAKNYYRASADYISRDGGYTTKERYIYEMDFYNKQEYGHIYQDRGGMSVSKEVYDRLNSIGY